MIYVKIIGHNFIYELKEMILQYFHKGNIVFLDKDDKQDLKNVYLIRIVLEKRNDGNIVYTKIEMNGKEIAKSEIRLTNNYFLQNKKITLQKIKMTLYHAMKDGFDHILPWGVLTGIRPGKIVHKLIDQGFSKDEILNLLKNNYLLSKDKADLLMNVAENERDIIYPICKKTISLYIGIPFCPSRCIYCSFLSFVLTKDRSILEKYMDTLKFEIKRIANYIKDHNLHVKAIYIGGGTPTILNTGELKSLLYTIGQELNLKDVKEYTLEAGRPDTIDREKLKIALQYGISRISINPQTMNENTLNKIGRNHSPADIIKSFYLAREMGFNFINMDLILGLPGENCKTLINTLNHIKYLQPENLTIHIMSLKRGSKLYENIDDIPFDWEKNITEMQEISKNFASDNGYFPYYLYRQKYMLGNLENVGYCKEGYKSVYNILMMSEKQTIIGLGAGSVTKVFFPQEDRIERFPNVKDVGLYNKRIKEMIDQKLILLDSLYSVD